MFLYIDNQTQFVFNRTDTTEQNELASNEKIFQ